MYDGSRRPIATSQEGLLTAVASELRALRVSRPVVVVSGREGEARTSYLLQRWSNKWEEYVDVSDTSEVQDGDRITVRRTQRSQV